MIKSNRKAIVVIQLIYAIMLKTSEISNVDILWLRHLGKSCVHCYCCGKLESPKSCDIQIFSAKNEEWKMIG
jgi:hypothetical protein